MEQLIDQLADKATDKTVDRLLCASGGAAIALTAAVFVPATLLLGVGAIAAGGTYLYLRRSKPKQETGAAQDTEKKNKEA